MGFIGLTSGILGPILPLYFRSKGFSVVEWSVLASLMAVGLTGSEIVWGVLSDRIGRKIILAVTSLLLSFIIPLYTVTTLFPVFALLQVVYGSLFCATGPASRAYISDRMSPKRLGMAMGLWVASINSGRIVGSILGPYLAENWSYLTAFSFAAITSFISCGIAFTLLTETKQQKPGNRVPVRKTFQRLFQRKQVFLLFGVGILAIMGKTLIGAFLPLFAIDLFGASSVDVGGLLAVFTLSLVLTTFLSGPLSDKVGKEPVIFIGFILLLCSSLSFLRINTVSLAFLATMGIAAGFAFVSPSVLALVSGLVGKEAYGSAMGLFGTFEDAGIMLAPLLYGFTWTLFGIHSIFYIGALIQVLGIILVLFMKK